LQPDHVYTIPPGSDLTLHGGRFHLLERAAPRTLHLPIDTFFRSLAEEQKEQAIAIVLSGTGSDGALGLAAIKEQGGTVLVQDPATAAFDGMPRSAIATGLADLILAPEEMPERILGYVRQGYLPGQGQDQEEPDLTSAAGWLPSILGVLATRTGHDFSDYKPSTIVRRIERRMALNQAGNAESYLRYLQADQAEAQQLFADLLIGVTRFFRDAEAFAALQEHAIPHFLSERARGQRGEPGHESLRIWVPGCATGEEAYSIAMLVQEAMEASGNVRPVTIFASDLDSRAIDKARRAIYPLSVAADVGPERLARFFVETDGRYQVADHIRKMVVFATHDLINDPPFSRLDLISCRNLLIYLGGASQKRVADIFHYALKPGGVLFLGSAELPESSRRLFVPLDRKHRIFQRLAAGGPRRSALTYQPAAPAEKRAAPARGKESGPLNLRENVEQMLLANAPACLVINRAADILYVHGRTGKYLETPTGEVGQPNALRMARAGLGAPLSAALGRALTEKQAVSYDRVRVKTNGDEVCLRLTARPLPALDGDEEFLTVTFEELPQAACIPGTAAAGNEASDDQSGRIAELERDLRAAQEYLQATVEELESANEELRSANEELQSTNEELVTSREELQSVNEELVTLNADHEARIEELTVVNADLVNLLTRLDTGIIFLDRKLQIRRFNPAATRISNLVETDLGRPLSDLASHLADDHLVADAQEVLETQTDRQAAVQARDGRWYQAHLQVYRGPDHAPDGVMLTFADITEQKTAREYAEQVVEAVREPLLILDHDLRVVSANRAYYKAFAAEHETTEGRLIDELGGGRWTSPRLRAALAAVRAEDATFEDLRIDGEDGSEGLVVNARRLVRQPGQPPLILLAVANPHGAL
ncbi:MAG TPA: CheR family methyltransferase, partial [Anaerolineae bacterium]